MKALVLLLCGLAITGCAGKAIVIPDKPEFQNILVYPVEGGMFIDTENILIMKDNIDRMDKYCDELKKLLQENIGGA